MNARFAAVTGCMLAVAMILASAAPSAQAAAAKGAPVFGSPAAAKEAGPDFDIQGEYEGTAGKDKIGVQVIALGNGAFSAVFLPGGLPGAGWDGKAKILSEGTLKGGKVVLALVEGNRTYMAGPPSQFMPTKALPPKPEVGGTATIADGKITGKTDDGEAITAKKVERKSPTLGAKPPKGALVLLAYTPGTAPSLDEWTNTKWKPMPCGCMQVQQKSGTTKTKKTFSGAWTLHIEFRSPFMPTARSQGRGNSGVFPPGGREVQVLDSFGLEGMPNECGGIYKSHSPAVNMCLPPLSWQTYDITYDPGKDGKPASYKVVHNGVVIHEKIELGKARTGDLNLQDHGNPVAYRNIWIVPAGK